MAVTIARFAGIGRIADAFTPVGIAATRATPCTGIKQPANPPQGMEAEIALAAATAFIAALAATAALAAVIAIDAFAIGTTNRPVRRTAVALTLTAALAAATSVLQEPATPG
jgi:hypothetical protein